MTIFSIKTISEYGGFDMWFSELNQLKKKNLLTINFYWLSKQDKLRLFL